MSENITPAEHLAEVQATFSGDPRTVEIMRAAVKHLHAFVGGRTHPRRVVRGHPLPHGSRAQVRRRPPGVHPPVRHARGVDARGDGEPGGDGRHHRADRVRAVPRGRLASKEFGESIIIDDAGDPLVLQGTVTNLDGEPIAGATLDVWEVGSNGLYDVQNEGHGMDLQGIFTTDDQGRYEVRTVRPVDYTIPEDGPVGRMLRTTGRHAWRPAHIHLVASAPGYKTVTTHAFDAGSKYLDSGAVFGVRSPSSSTWRTARHVRRRTRPRLAADTGLGSRSGRIHAWRRTRSTSITNSARWRVPPASIPSTCSEMARRSTGTRRTRSCTARLRCCASRAAA